MILLRFALWVEADPVHLAAAAVLAVALGFNAFIGALTILRAAWRRLRAMPVLQERQVVKIAEAICRRSARVQPASPLDQLGQQVPPSSHPSADSYGGPDD